jgi:ubiquinone/menaquinone biosynthesis C-methylase UbiE
MILMKNKKKGEITCAIRKKQAQKNHKSNNLKKHQTNNPFARFLINRFYRKLVSQARRQKPKTILDVGCGEGFTITRIKKALPYSTIEGTDISQSSLDFAQKIHQNIRFQASDVQQKIPYNDDSFDLVLCTEVLEHLKRPEKALKELARVTKKTCIISVPHEPYFSISNLSRGKNIRMLGKDPEHINFWNTKSIRKVLGKMFAIRKITTSFPWIIIICEKRR